jgi:hypothetical protein
MRRGRKEEETPDQSEGTDDATSDTAAGDDTTGTTGDDTSASEDGTTGDDTSAPEDGTTGDDSSDGGDFVISDGSDDGSTVISDGSDDGSAVISDGSDDGSAVISADDDGEFTISDGSSEGDVLSADSDDSAVISADDDGGFTISDGSSEGDGSSDSTSGDSAVIGDGSSDGDAAISDDSSEGDAPVLTGDDTDTGDQVDPNAPVQEADGPSAEDVGLGSDSGTGVRFEPRSELAKEVHDIEKATEPQLDPEVVQARLGGLGPQPPQPRGPLDDSPDELAFGKGADAPVTRGLESSHDVAADLEVEPRLEPVGRFSADAPDGLDPAGGPMPEDGLDPAAANPPDAGLGPHEVQIDDTSDHSEPTEVDIG